ncbi:MAG: single-stranded-DNA-specific exonuclease RecJ [Planctomycetales bacterium]|nr:single-stranded-DNA-specific exonuclease RecJ [Planctomycetales bacterium]
MLTDNTTDRRLKVASRTGLDRTWNFTPMDATLVDSLARRSSVSPVVAQLLLKRGITQDDDIRRFLDAKLMDLRPPAQLPGLNAAVECIWQAIELGKETVVYGDYDADGMTATAILYGCLKLLGCKVSYHLPNRMDEGYGLHVESIEKLAARGKQLIITVDCGVASLEPAIRARELGLSLVITDHHRYGDSLPDADAIVHPALPGGDYPFSGLCGAGVAFKLAWALCQRHSGSVRVTDRLREFLMQALGLAAIGTVADVVPLVDENRIIVRNGLTSIQKFPSLGLRKLMDITKISEKSELGAEDIGFTLAPRLNAAGRLGQAQLGVELLVTEDESRATALATYIQELNENRNKLERSIHLAATKQLKEVHSLEDDPAIVLASPNWHPGVIGIVAGKLAEKHHRPVVLIALDKLGTKPGMGSARCPTAVNLHEAFQQCADLLVSGGGHAAAAGLKIEESNVAAFRAAFLEAVAEQSDSDPTRPTIDLDAEATLDQLDLATVTQIEKLSPFGMGNPRPMFCAMGLRIAEEPKLLGTSGKHFSVQLEQFGRTMRAVSFGQAEEWLPKLEKIGGPIDMVFRPVINEFRGYRKVEVHIVDWRPSSQELASEGGKCAIPAPHF